jgi:hypothetical protein
MRDFLLRNTNKDTDLALEEDGEIVGSSIELGTFALRKWDGLYDEIPSQISEYDRNGDMVWEARNPDEMAKGKSGDFQARLGANGWIARLAKSGLTPKSIPILLITNPEGQFASISSEVVTRLYWRVYKRLYPDKVFTFPSSRDLNDYRKEKEEILWQALVVLTNLKA